MDIKDTEPIVCLFNRVENVWSFMKFFIFEIKRTVDKRLERCRYYRGVPKEGFDY